MSEITITTTSTDLIQRLHDLTHAAESIRALNMGTPTNDDLVDNLITALIDTLLEETEDLPDKTPTTPAVPVFVEQGEILFYVIRKMISFDLLTPKLYTEKSDAEDALKALTTPADRRNYVVRPFKTAGL